MRRSDRRFLVVDGRSPGEMLNGVLSGRIPPPLRSSGEGWSEGEAPYSTMLTPKGKMVTDLRLLPFQGGVFLMDLPRAGMEGALRHLRKYLNPRFAQAADRSDELGMISVVGPDGPGLVSGALGYDVRAPGEGELLLYQGKPGPDLRLLGNSEVRPVAMDLLLPMESLAEVWERLEEAGVRPMDTPSWDVLRIERGTPLFGVDMTEETLPVEAGIHLRAIDYQKGCYIGQEVIVRIRDRGKVNKSLRWILLGDTPVPSGGADLYLPEDLPPPDSILEDDPPAGEPVMGGSQDPERGGRKAGWVTSACRSPRFGETVALGFIKRAVPMGSEVRLGEPLGPRGRVEALDWDGKRESSLPGA